MARIHPLPDLLVSQIVRTNEAQSWFVHEHLRKQSKA